MANTNQAKKRVRQAEQHRVRNTGDRSALRTSVKKVVAAVGADDAAKAQEAYREAVPMIDRMARKGIIHKNKAARHKSRLNQHIRKLQSS